MNKFFLLLLVFISCTPKPVQSGDRIQAVTFGSGGGFTGRYTTYSLDMNANILTGSRGDSIPVSVSEVKEIRNKLESIRFFEYSVNHPYNITYFIEVVSETDSNRVVWGEPGFDLPEGIRELHGLLLDLTAEK